jgi:hypothetical protein
MIAPLVKMLKNSAAAVAVVTVSMLFFPYGNERDVGRLCDKGDST